MKTIKFRSDLARLITNGKKTTTWRLFDDKDLKAGDIIEMQNKETGEVFGRAAISEVAEKPIKDLNDHDWEGHERFPSEEAMYEKYREYYPGHDIGPTTLVKIIHFARYSESAGGVVLNKKGEVLVVNQKNDSWSLPKGHIDPGEDALTAAKREIYEESGIRDIRLIKELGAYERYRIGKGGEGNDKSWLKKLTMFLFETDEEQLRPVDPDNPEARWVKKEDVAALLTHPKDKEFFRSVDFSAVSGRFRIAKEKIAATIAHSATEEDPGHSENAWTWLLRLSPSASEVLQLAVLGHDIERALPDRLTRKQFATYDEYKSKHAKRAGELVAQIMRESGYDEAEAQAASKLIGEAEFSSDDPNVQLITDADSLSYFDYNIDFYLKRNGEEKTKEKVRFMYDRASARAKKEIDKIVEQKPSLRRMLRS